MKARTKLIRGRHIRMMITYCTYSNARSNIKVATNAHDAEQCTFHMCQVVVAVCGGMCVYKFFMYDVHEMTISRIGIHCTCLVIIITITNGSKKIIVHLCVYAL